MFDPKRFKESLEVDLAAAQTSVGELESMHFRYVAHTDGDNAAEEERLRSLLDRAYLKVTLALEMAGARETLTEVRERWKAYLEEGLAELKMNAVGESLYSPALETLDNAAQAFFAAAGVGDAQQVRHDLLVQMLEQTPSIVELQGVEPSCEADVRRTLFSHLRLVFPDIAREIPISKPSKTYKPDFGVRSLRAAIEYKFVDSEDDAKKTLGEIYEDIHGYAGSLDWTEFYFVIYQTGNFLTRHVIDAEWRVSEPHKRWHPIVVFGKGSRKIAKNAAPKVPKPKARKASGLATPEVLEEPGKGRKRTEK